MMILPSEEEGKLLIKISKCKDEKKKEELRKEYRELAEQHPLNIPDRFC